MGFVSRSVVVVVVTGAAALAGLTAPAGAVDRDSPTHRATTGLPAGTSVYCGTQWGGGLAVHAPSKSVCPTALKVAKAFYVASQKTSVDERPVTVTVDRVPWKCESRDGTPNPHIACVNQNDRSQQFQLNS